MVTRTAIFLAPLLLLAGCGPNLGLTASSSPASSSPATMASRPASSTTSTEPTETTTATTTPGATPTAVAANGPRVQLYCDLDHPVRYVARRIVNRACSAHAVAVWVTNHPSAAVPDVPPPTVVTTRTKTVTGAPTTAAARQSARTTDADPVPYVEAPAKPQPHDPDPTVVTHESTPTNSGGKGIGGVDPIGAPDPPYVPSPGGSGHCRDSKGRFTHC